MLKCDFNKIALWHGCSPVNWMAASHFTRFLNTPVRRGFFVVSDVLNTYLINSYYSGKVISCAISTQHPIQCSPLNQMIARFRCTPEYSCGGGNAWWWSQVVIRNTGWYAVFGGGIGGCLGGYWLGGLQHGVVWCLPASCDLGRATMMCFSLPGSRFPRPGDLQGSGEMFFFHDKSVAPRLIADRWASKYCSCLICLIYIFVLFRIIQIVCCYCVFCFFRFIHLFNQEDRGTFNGA